MPVKTHSDKSPDDLMQTARDRLVLAACPLAGAHGWSQDVLLQACRITGQDEAVVAKFFPNGAVDAIDHMSDWADREMLRLLAASKAPPKGVRGAIHHAIMTRWQALAPYREAAKSAFPYMTRPWLMGRGQKMVWRTADKVWIYAGDTATDYNYYTKRALLSGVLLVATPVWIKGNDKETSAFLSRRLDNVVNIGKKISQFKPACKTDKTGEAA